MFPTLQLRVDPEGQLALVGGHEYNATWIKELRAPPYDDCGQNSQGSSQEDSDSQSGSDGQGGNACGGEGCAAGQGGVQTCTAQLASTKV